MVGLGGGEGGEVVRAGQDRGAGVERLAVDAVWPPERPPELEWARCRAGQQAIAVGARAGVAAGVEALGDDAGADYRDVVGADPLPPPNQIPRRLGGLR